MNPKVRKARNLFVSVLGEYIETGRTKIIKRTRSNICELLVDCLINTYTNKNIILTNLKKIFAAYPEFSGNPLYPVKGVRGMNSEDTYYYQHFSKFWIGEYGNNRRELAIYLLKHVDDIFNTGGSK